MRYLLDVNVLIALIDPMHVLHSRAHTWFFQTGIHGWATCPLIENGVLRIVGHASYGNSPGTPAAVASVLAAWLEHAGHQFWSDSVSILDSGKVHVERLLTSAQVTDTYLLALAASHGGKLATFDRQLVTNAIPKGAGSLHLIQ